jgi:hypothetical protein
MTLLLQTLPEFPKPLSETIWLVGSSFFFLIPGTYAFLYAYSYKWLYLYGSLSLSTTICSVNHWRRAEDGIRRKIDIAAASIAFIAYVITGFVFMPLYLSFGTVATIISSFIVSDYLSRRRHPYWFLPHMFFHLSVSATKCFIIYYIIHTTAFNHFT